MQFQTLCFLQYVLQYRQILVQMKLRLYCNYRREEEQLNMIFVQLVQLLTLLTLSPSLRYLHLSYIPTLVELPFSFQNLHKLAILEIRNCENLETLPTRIYLQSLRFLDLSGCSKLRTFPDISTNIEDLNLSKTAIEEVPPWIEKFTNLHKLEMKGCVNLETLPTGINLPSLECLNLSGCSRFRDFPDISTNITYLNLSQTAIEEVPCWIEKFSWLRVLKMDGCNKFLQA